MGLFDFFKRKNQVRESMGDAAISLHNSAVLLMDQGLYEPAEAKFKQSLTIFEEYFDVDCPAVVKGLESLARLYEKIGQYAQAEMHYKRALAIKEKGLGSHHPDVIQSQENLAEFHRKINNGNTVEALKETGEHTKRHNQVVVFTTYLVVKYDTSDLLPLVVARLNGGDRSEARDRAFAHAVEMGGTVYSAPGMPWEHEAYQVGTRLPVDTEFTLDEMEC